MSDALRLMIYDGTWARGDQRSLTQTGLTSSWVAGGVLYAALGRLHRRQGVRSWGDALQWLLDVEPARPIAEIQFWGHGRWGGALVGTDVLDRHAVEDPHHPLHASLQRLRPRLSPSSLWWFRTCETFGRAEGHAFASAWTRFFGCRAAGHTYVIGPLQSGLHSLAPGELPQWSIQEGLRPDVTQAPVALTSSWSAPHTVTCLHGAVPDGW